MAFRGQFDYSLDAKNRLNVPAKFRPAFSGGVVLAKALEPCVAIWAPDSFETWTESFLSNLNPVSRERRTLTRYFAGNSFDVELDSAGRVTLTAPLLKHAGISKRPGTRSASASARAQVSSGTPRTRAAAIAASALETLKWPGSGVANSVSPSVKREPLVSNSTSVAR